MASFGRALKSAREAALLGSQDLARLTGFSQSDLERWEADGVATGERMERCALAFGVRVRDLLRGEGQRADLAMLFKLSASSSSPETARAQLLELEAGLGLGTFSRAMFDLADLVGLKGERQPPLPDLSEAYANRPQNSNPSEHLAQAARRALGLGNISPIQSMRAVFEQLQVPLFFADQDEVDRRVNGVSLVHPMAGVLINPLWGRPWVTRMTLAHELGHLLFHLERGFSISPAGHAWVLRDGHATVERESDAFAASFLAPAFAVQDLLQNVPPASAEAIAAVVERFGVGREVAVSRIVDTFRLTSSARDELLSGRPAKWETSFEEDVVRDEELGIRRGVLRTATFEALTQGRISATRARSILGIPDTAWLEGEALSDDLRRPKVSHEDVLARRAQGALAERGLTLHAVGLVPSNNGWKAQLLDLMGRDAGTANLDEAGALLEVQVHPSSCHSG
jgi:Zn-dependent peptidase ImmA (M78 family)